MVTALKRGTRLQETPISISAIGSEQLTNSGVQNIGNLQSTVPSLTFVDAGPSQRRVVIRGIQASGEPTVGVYYDETPVTGPVGTASDAGATTPELRLFDVERVEVLRGPQGTLYGSGSMGGTLRIIYKKPIFELGGTADVSLSGTENGGFNHQENAVINIPVINDKLAVRAVGFYQRNEGYIDNTFLRINNINNEVSYGGRILVRAKPTDRLTLDGAAFFNVSNTDTPNWSINDGVYQTSNRIRLPVRDNIKLYDGTAVWDLGGVSLTAVGSYMDRHLYFVNDVSRYIQSLRTPARCAGLVNGGRPCNAGALAGYYNLVDSESTSGLLADQALKATTAELRMSSSGERAINWTAGVFYSRRKTDIINGEYNADPATGVIIRPLQTDTLRTVDDILKQVAAFADVSVDLTHKFNVTGGVRFFRFDKSVTGDTSIPSVLVGSVFTPLTTTTSHENGKVFKLNASYKITRDIMLYGEFAQGFRPGGVNQVIGLPVALGAFGSDRLNNYEVGIKSSFFDRSLILNLDAFQIDWSDIQVTGRTPNGAFSFITNAGKARVKGIEFETTLKLVRGLSLQGSASYTDAVLSENQSNGLITAPGLKGDRIPYVPQFSAGLGAEYDLPIGNFLNSLYRVDVTHSSGSLSDFRPNGAFTRPIEAYELVNARIGIETAKPNWGAYLFATNLFNAVTIIRESIRGTDAGFTSTTSARPRTLGVNLRKSF